jgi:hypothetical protein
MRNKSQLLPEREGERIVNTYACPVCGYGMPFPAEDDNICSCCGTHFGYDDVCRTHREIARLWIANGASWFSEYVSPPPTWNVWQQMIGAGLVWEIPWLVGIQTVSTVKYVPIPVERINPAGADRGLRLESEVTV